MIRWAVFLSGRGSNAQVAFEELSQINIGLCVSSKKSALGLQKARRAGVPTLVLDKIPDWRGLDEELRKRKINRILLLGFMKIIPPEFCEKWQGRIWNLHPSLLPEFKGADAIERSFAAGAEMGISIHEVTAEMDAGLVLAKKRITQKAAIDFAELKLAAQSISRAEQLSVRKFIINKNINNIRLGL